MKRIRENRSGFTLIELLIVAFVLGIMTMIVLPTAMDRYKEKKTGGEETTAKGGEEIAGISSGQGAIKIDYDYGGRFGVFGIADAASAYFEDDTLIAQAEAIRIIKEDSGPNLLEVEETHFSKSGEVTYWGKLTFRFRGGGAMLITEEPIVGRKLSNIFNSWPSGV